MAINVKEILLNRFVCAVMARNAYNQQSSSEFHQLPGWRYSCRSTVKLPGIAGDKPNLLAVLKRLQQMTFDEYRSELSPSTVCLAIRGTKNVGDVFTDFDLIASEPKIILALIEELFAHLQSLKDSGITRVYLTGHSLGGFLAQMLTLRAEGTALPIEFCQTFEAPGGCRAIIGENASYADLDARIRTASKKMQNVCVSGSAVSGNSEGLGLIGALTSSHFKKFDEPMGEMVCLEYSPTLMGDFIGRFEIKIDPAQVGTMLARTNSFLGKATDSASGESSQKASTWSKDKIQGSLPESSISITSGSLSTTGSVTFSAAAQVVLKVLEWAGAKIVEEIQKQVCRHSILLICQALGPQGDIPAVFNPVFISRGKDTHLPGVVVVAQKPAIDGLEKAKANKNLSDVEKQQLQELCENLDQLPEHVEANEPASSNDFDPKVVAVWAAIHACCDLGAFTKERPSCDPKLLDKARKAGDAYKASKGLGNEKPSAQTRALENQSSMTGPAILGVVFLAWAFKTQNYLLAAALVAAGIWWQSKQNEAPSARSGPRR